MDIIGGMKGTDYSSYITNSRADSVNGSLSKAKGEKATDAEMLEACKEFEQYMVEQVYKAMEKTIPKSEDEKNDYMEYFGDYRIQAYAKAVTEQGKLGLADQLYEAMKRNNGE